MGGSKGEEAGSGAKWTYNEISIQVEPKQDGRTHKNRLNAHSFLVLDWNVLYMVTMTIHNWLEVAVGLWCRSLFVVLT